MSDNLTPTTLGTEFTTESASQQRGGGLLSFLTGANDNDKLLLKALREKEFEAASFMIRNNSIGDYSVCDDENGYTALHYMVLYAGAIPNSHKLINQMLQNGADCCVNVRDKLYGDTPLHVAVKTNNNAIADLLISHGARKDIRNQQDLYVKTEDSESSVFIKQTDYTDGKNIMSDNVMIITMNPAQSPFSDDLPDHLLTITEAAPAPRSSVFRKQMPAMSDTSDNFVNTDGFVAVMKGGNRNVEGRRPINMNRMHGSDLSESSEGSNGELRNLSRFIRNQASEIHERAVKKIMELMNVDEQTAKYYKAELYRRVKADKPELNNFDRAVELEKLVSEDILKDIDIDKVSSEIQKTISEREKARGDGAPRVMKLNMNTKFSEMTEQSSDKPKRKAKKDDQIFSDMTSSSSMMSDSSEKPKRARKSKATSESSLSINSSDFGLTSDDF